MLLAPLLQGADEPYIGPYVQTVTAGSAVIFWETDMECAGMVELGESEGAASYFREDTVRTIHAVRVAGLSSDTRYVYRALWDGKATQWHSLRTLPPEGTRHFRLAAYGDSRSNPPVHSQVVRGMLEHDPAIVIHTGDLVSDGTKKEHWKPQFFDPLKPLASKVPVITCMGNHEKDASLFYEYFDRKDSTSWFAYRWANVHFIVLDSQKPYDKDSEQYKWLEKELNSPDSDWRVVFFHYPMFSCHPTRDVNTNRWAWQDLFDTHGVDLVLTGHDHYYHRTHRIGRAWDANREGVYHITTAGGGASLYPVEDKVYTAYAQSVHHFMIFDFDAKRVTGQAIGADGKLIDKFTIDRTRPESTPFVSYEMILWQKALHESVDKIDPEPADPRHGRIERAVKLPSFFKEPNTIAYRWGAGSSFWAADLCDGIVEVKDRADFNVSLWGEGPLRTMYPLPRLELLPLKTPPGAKDYLNRTLVLHPLRVAASRPVKIPRLPAKIKVDGKAGEPEWKNAYLARGFTREYGRYLSERETFRIGYDDDGIVIAATVQSLVEKPIDKGAKDRDTKHLYRTDESITLVLTPPSLPKIPEVTFQFSGNSRGTRFDSLSNLREWNPEWEYATAEIPGGWQAEARIPWGVLSLTGPSAQIWKMNLFRWDSSEKMLGEWAPTFSAFGTSRKHDAPAGFER